MAQVSTPPRGIANISGVACHLSSALQLLLYAIPEIRMALMTIEQHASTENSALAPWILQLARFTSLSTDAIDPSNLYRALEHTTRLDPHELGDAATALRILLRELSKEPSLEQLVKVAVTGGVLHQTVVGKNNDTIVRTKQLKDRSMPCPFPLATRDCESLAEALTKATVEPQPILGYHWNSQEEDTSDWTTTRSSSFSDLPQHLLLHLQRFRVDDGEVKLVSNELDIPGELDMTPYCQVEESSCCHCYQFSGAILHVDDGDSSDEQEEGGHYVALVRQAGQDGGLQWYSLDDEHVSTITCSELELLDFLSGRPSAVEIRRNEESSCCATLLLYSRTCQCTDTKPLMEDLQSHLQKQEVQCDSKTETIDWNRPQDLVGRRLKVKWKSGRCYPGVVASYNEESGKHCIHYDDGDIREYKLRKKTIQWLI